MTTKAGVGMSRHHNPNVAGREAAQQALEKAGIVKPGFVFMFGSIGYDQPSLLRVVRETGITSVPWTDSIYATATPSIVASS